MNEQEFFRRDFPIVKAKQLGGERDDGAIEEHLSEFRDQLANVLADDELKAQFIKFCMVSNPVRKARRMPEIASLSTEITARTAFELPADQKLLANYDDAERPAVLIARGFVFSVRHVPRAFLDVIVDGTQPITGERILEACPELAWDRAREMLLEMYDRGLLVVREE